MGRIGGSRVWPGTVHRAFVAVAAIAAGTGGVSAQVTFGCLGSVPMIHGLDSYFLCEDAVPVSALAY